MNEGNRFSSFFFRTNVTVDGTGKQISSSEALNVVNAAAAPAPAAALEESGMLKFNLICLLFTFWVFQ